MYVVADPFTNRLVFVMPDSMKSINPFLERIPNELQEQYVTDCMTEMLKLVMGEANKNNDGVIPLSMESSLHLQGKHESSGHLYDAVCN
jgi:hypothetical protein